MTNQFVKDPQAVLDYQVDWSAWLDGDTLAASTWSVPAGLTKADEDFDDSTATIWLSGGTAGSAYRLTNHITTTAGRQDERSLTITVREK